MPPSAYEYTDLLPPTSTQLPRRLPSAPCRFLLVRLETRQGTDNRPRRTAHRATGLCAVLRKPLIPPRPRPPGLTPPCRRKASGSDGSFGCGSANPVSESPVRLCRDLLPTVGRLQMADRPGGCGPAAPRLLRLAVDCSRPICCPPLRALRHGWGGAVRRVPQPSLGSPGFTPSESALQRAQAGLGSVASRAVWAGSALSTERPQ